MFEGEPLKIITKGKRMVAYKYEGSWQCVDSK